MKTIRVSIAEALKASRKERKSEKGIWRQAKAPKELISENTEEDRPVMI